VDARPSVQDEINARHTNQRSVPGLVISPAVHAVTALDEALRSVDLIFAVVPSQAFVRCARS